MSAELKSKSKGSKAKTGSKKARKLEPVTVGEALRMLGMDERKLAREYFYLIYEKTNRDSGGATQAKLRALDKWQTLLESSDRLTGEAAEENFEEMVKLIHEVERPDRGEEETETEEAAGSR